MQNFQPHTWQTIHTKMLDKWQLGDITQDDLLEWALWLDSVAQDIPMTALRERDELIALIFDEEDEFLLIKKAKILLLAICEQLNLDKPRYDFADDNYGLTITEPYYQQLLPMITDEDLVYISKLDYGIDSDEHYKALKKTIYEQNGKINYEKQHTWFPHEVLSLGHWYCEDNFEIAYALCNCLLARNMLMNNNLFGNDDFEDFSIAKNLIEPLAPIVYYHINYASRLNFSIYHSSLYCSYKNLN